MKSIIEQEKEIEVVEEFDVIVCGSGPAGVSAAIAAARNGAKTALFEVMGCLGGTWTAGYLTWIIDHDNKAGLMAELCSDLIEMSGDNRPSSGSALPFDADDMKYLLEEKCVECDVKVRLHTRVVGVHKDKSDEIRQVITESKSGREAWTAKVFIDATGDGDLAFQAGCEFDMGDPETGATQPMSMLSLITGPELSDIREFVNGYGEWHTDKDNLREAMEKGGVTPSYAMPTIFHLRDNMYMIMANHQYGVSAINADDVTTATINGRREVQEQIRALKSLGGKWEKISLVATADQIGTREARRIKGLYEISVNDMIEGAMPDDSICVCTFGIDVHSPDPSKGKGIASSGKYKTKPYGIPLRSMMSKDIKNLMMAGRCISGDFLSHSSYRVTGTAAPIGEAAGIAAALASVNDISVSEVDAQKVNDLI